MLRRQQKGMSDRKGVGTETCTMKKKETVISVDPRAGASSHQEGRSAKALRQAPSWEGTGDRAEALLAGRWGSGGWREE